jgi:Raf kinase inhibitor-like YbhB/YbcL family protein
VRQRCLQTRFTAPGAARRVALLAGLLLAACSSAASPPAGGDDGEGGAGGAAGRGSGGSAAAGGSAGRDAAPDLAADLPIDAAAEPGDSGSASADAAGDPPATDVAAEGGSPDDAGPGGPFALTSPAFKEGDDIAKMYRCPPAENVSPPLAWSAGPAGTQSYAVTLARAATVHWVVWDMPAATRGLAAGLTEVAEPPVPAGSKQLAGGYFGPCPQGGRVDYVIAVHALDVAKLPGVTLQSTAKQLTAALQKATLARATLTVFGAK